MNYHHQHSVSNLENPDIYQLKMVPLENKFTKTQQIELHHFTEYN